MARPSRSTAHAVGIEGLDEFRRDLRAYGTSVPRLLGQANHDAAELGAQRGQERAAGLGSTAAHAAPSIRAGYSADEAYVALGSEEHPEALGAEFGSYHDIPRDTSRGKMRGWNQFDPWLGNQYQPGAEGTFGAGYFLGPALDDAMPDMLALYTRLLDEIERTVFNE